MTDIITVSVNIFDSIKKTSIIDTNIKSKYDKIFEKYECFFKTNIGPKNIDPKNNKYGTNHHSKKIDVFLHEQPVRTPIKKQKTLHQEILGLLNVLNKANYSKILSKFRLMASKENITVLVEEILHKSCLQIVYVSYYTQLLLDLIEKSGYSSQIIKTVEIFYKNLLESDYIIFQNKSNITDEYDLFCTEQKHKTLVQAKNNLVIILNKKNILMIDINEYIRFILLHLQKSLADIYHLDLILSLLVDIVSYTKEKINFFNHFQLVGALKNIIDNPPNKKISFITENILKKLV